MRILKWIAAIIAAPFVFSFFYAMTNRTGVSQTSSVEARQKAVEAERAKNPPPAPTWSYSSSADQMSKGVIHSASINSANTFQLDFPYKGEQHALLSIRDHPKFGKDVIFQIEKGQLICGVSTCKISVRFDEGNPRSFTASGSSDYDAKVLFIRDYQGFTQAMRKAKMVRIAPVIYQHGEVPMTFAVEGFDPAKFNGKAN